MKSAETVQATFHSDPPCRETISRIHDKFETEGTVGSIQKSSGHRRTAKSNENVSSLVCEFSDDPKMSIRQVSINLNLSVSSIKRILNENNIKPYWPVLLHKLNDDDFDRCLKFAEWFIIPQDDPNFPNLIVWSDKASLKLNGRLNHHRSPSDFGKRCKSPWCKCLGSNFSMWLDWPIFL